LRGLEGIKVELEEKMNKLIFEFNRISEELAQKNKENVDLKNGYVKLKYNLDQNQLTDKLITTIEIARS
jgi:hypothetical protein